MFENIVLPIHLGRAISLTARNVAIVVVNEMTEAIMILAIPHQYEGGVAWGRVCVDLLRYERHILHMLRQKPDIDCIRVFARHI